MKGEISVFTLDNLYRWCDNYGGGIVIASSVEDACEKLQKKHKEERGPYTIWRWKMDDYYDEDNVDVLDIYGD